MDTIKNDIYKLFQLDENGYTKRIFVFSGNQVLSPNDVFSENEKNSINEKNTEIIYSKQSFHKDDSVRIIKKKILRELSTLNPVSYDEIYLFTQKNDNQYSFLNAYKQITENEKYYMTRDMMIQFLINIGASQETNLLDDDDKETFKYEDIQSLPQEQIIKIALGQKFDKFRDPLFTANPYDIVRIFEKFVDINTNNVLKILENELLLNYGNIVDNNIYLCLAENVFTYASTNNFSENYFSQLYYPFLFKKDIFNANDLLRNKEKLMEENNKILSADDFKLYETIDMFYDIFQKKDSPLIYTENGVKMFKINLETDFKKLLPLEIIFKNIHATKSIPFIKYNPGSRKENIYRLYSTKIAKNGNRIPSLNESLLFKLSKEIGKPKQIALYIDFPVKKIELSVSFDYNGNIIIYGKMIQALPIVELNEILKTNIQPIINNMNYFLQNTGYSIRNFSSLTDDFITIMNMKYVSIIEIDGQISLTKIIGCISSVFDVIDDNIIKGARLIFKRVENFKEMDSQSSLIYEIYKTTDNKRNIINALMENYKMSENDALKRFGQFLVDNQQMNDRFVENPGFPVNVKYLAFEKKLVFEIDNIISIGYLEVLQIYIDSVGQILKNNAKQFAQKIDTLCRSQIVPKNTDKSHIENIVQTIEQPKVIASVALSAVELNNLFGDEEDDENEDNEGKEKKGDELDENDVLFDIEEDDDEQEDEDENNIVEKNDDEKKITEEEFEENDVFFDLDEDEDEDEIEENEEEVKGGEITESPIDNTSLTNPNPFQTKLEKSDSVLFSTRVDKNFKSYTTFCQSSAKKQPIILTEEEKNAIDKRDELNGSQSYVKESSFKYGSEPNKEFWYVCPRYFCLLTNTPISQEEVDKGTCGKIIPQNAKKIPKGHYVYEFNNPKEHNNESGEYIQHHPGFGKETTLEGFGIPCCYKNWKSKVHTELRKKFLDKSTEEEEEPQKEVEVDKYTEKMNFYVVNPTKFPVPRNRWGFLPPSVELFLQVDNNEFVSNDNRTIIKKNTPALLRYGVEQNDKQSFIACMADIYSYQNLLKTPISVQEMRTILLDSITLDNYIKLHNSSLVSIFQPKKINYSTIDIDKYANTDFFKTIDLQNDSQRDFLESTIASFGNFQKYLQDNESFIDHTYLWDIISLPNDKLIRNGLNLIILEITNKDATDNIELLCPTNAYSDSFYDSSKGSLLLLKQENYYEPIYYYENKNETIHLTKLFFEQNIQLKNLKKILLMIKSVQKTGCKPITNYPKEYEFRKNINISELKRILLEYELYIKKQVVNYQSKVIGLMVSDNEQSNQTIFIPCLPSGILKDITVEYMENDDLWSNYQNTVKQLSRISQKTSGKILCKPIIKVIDDGLIVGILTETNQFIQINPPTENIFSDDLTPIDQSNFILADRELITNRTPDKEREKTVKIIVNESKFYSMFRSKIRQLINEYENRNVKNQISHILSNIKNSYKRKLDLIEKLLIDLSRDSVIFQEDVNMLQNIDTDVNSPLVLPKINLVHKKENSKMYFLRIADELIRYNRIRLFMLNTNEFLNITDIEYKINADEFIILQSFLNTEYFDNLIPFNDNPNIKNNVFEMVNPISKQMYSNEIALTQQYSENQEQTNMNDSIKNCILETREIIGNPRSFWRKLFPNTTREILFKSGERCSFAVIIHIMQNLLKREFSIEIIKQSLIRFYEEPFRNYKSSILNLFKRQWKPSVWKSLNEGVISLSDAIMNENYTMTDLDIMLLSKHFKLPIVLFSTYKLKNLFDDDSIEWLILNNNNKDKFYFVRTYHVSAYINKPNDEERKSYSLIDTAFFLQEVRSFNESVNEAVSNQSRNIITFDELVIQNV